MEGSGGRKSSPPSGCAAGPCRPNPYSFYDYTFIYLKRFKYYIRRAKIHTAIQSKAKKKRFSIPAAAPKKSRHRLHLLLHHRLVPPPPAGLAGVRRGGEPNLCVEVSVKVVFSSKLS
jgi:hypothetical protein